MKKLIVSMMLIISMFAFAAESDPSATVGYVKYPCVVGKTFVALPMQDTYTTASTLSTSINTVMKFNSALQGWESATKGLFGWSNDFAVSSGQPYLVNSTATHDFIVDDEVAVNPAYNIVTTKNGVMVPLTKSNMLLADDYFDETGVINTVMKFNTALQGWESATKGLFGWSNNFAISIGDPHIVNATGPVTWPGTKGAIVDGELPDLSPKAEPREIVVRVKDRLDQEYDAVTVAGVTFKAWFLERPAEIINQDNTWSRVEHYFGMVGACIADLQDFTSPWAVGETLHFLMKDENDGLKVYYEGVQEWIVDDLSATKVELGLEDFGLAGSGFPVLLNVPSSIEGNNVPTETKLHQNYPNPFNPTTTIKFDLASNSNVKLNVYNYNGQLVKSLVNGQMKAGYHSVNFDASNFSAGVYYYTMETASKTSTQKMVLVK